MMRKILTATLMVILVVEIGLFSSVLNAATDTQITITGVSIQDGEDWSLPNWITGWSSYGGILLFWTFGVSVPYDNPNVDVRRELDWPPTRWKDIHTGEGQFNWTILDNRIATVANAGKKYILFFQDSSVGKDYMVPQWVINLYPNTATTTCEGGTCYKMWTTGMGDKFKDFLVAVANRYKNDSRVAYAYPFYETVNLHWKGGIPISEFTPYYESLFELFANTFGPAKTIIPAHDPKTQSYTALVKQLGANIMNTGSYDIVWEQSHWPFLNQYYDTNTGYTKMLSRPTQIFASELEEVGLPYDYIKLNMLVHLRRLQNWPLYAGYMYMVQPGQTLTDPTTGNVYDGSKYVPLRDYVRKTQGYPTDKAPDAFAVLREMQKKISPYDTMKNIEMYLYQRDGVAGGVTKKTEYWLWNDIKASNVYHSTFNLYTAKDRVGYEARSTDKATGNNYIYFGLDDAFMYGGTNNVAIKVYYKDVGTVSWRIEYDAADGNKYKPTTSVTNTNSGKWKTATFTINDAKFANGQGTANGIDINGDGDYQDAGEKDGLDFRIYNGGSQDITVGMVRVLRLDNPSAASTETSITIDAGTVLRNVNRDKLSIAVNEDFFYDSNGNIYNDRVALAKTLTKNTTIRFRHSGITIEHVEKQLSLANLLSAEMVYKITPLVKPSDAAYLAQKIKDKGYNIKYFEIGNEPYWDNFGPGDGDAYEAVEFANLFVQISRAMKAVDPTIKVGLQIKERNDLTGANALDMTNKIKWNPTVLDIAKNDADFVVPHFYLPSGPGQAGMYVPPAEEYYQALGATATKELKRLVDEIQNLLNQKAPTRTIEIIPTEWGANYGHYNGWLGWPQPYPYMLQNSLTTDLFTASVLNYLLKESQIPIAHNFILGGVNNNTSEAWNLIQVFNSQVIKRSKYPVFELYANYLGDSVVKTSVVSPTYDFHGTQTYSWAPNYFYNILKDITGIPYLDVLTTKSSDGKKIYLTVVNWNKDNSLSTQINLNGFTPQPNANVFTLNAGNKSLTPTQAIQESREYGVLHLDSKYYNENNIKIYSSSISNAAPSFTYSFEPHSVTVIELFAESSGTPPKADLNNDLKVDIKDIQLCVRVILGIETDLKIIQRAKEVALPLDKADIKDIQGIVKIILGG